jgi:hypothetical protein
MDYCSQISKLPINVRIVEIGMKVLKAAAVSALVIAVAVPASAADPDIWFRLGNSFGTSTGGSDEPGDDDTDDGDPTDPTCVDGVVTPGCPAVPGGTPASVPLHFVSVESRSTPISTLTPAGSPFSYTGAVVVDGGKPEIDLKFNAANLAGTPPIAAYGITFSVQPDGKSGSFHSTTRNCDGNYSIVKAGDDWSYTATVDPACYGITSLPLIATDSEGKTARWNPAWKPGPTGLYAGAVPGTMDLTSGTAEFTFEVSGITPYKSFYTKFDAPASTYACGVDFPATCKWLADDYGVGSLEIVSERMGPPNIYTGISSPLKATVDFRIEDVSADPYSTTVRTVKVVAKTVAGFSFPVTTVFRPSISLVDYYDYPATNSASIPATSSVVKFDLPHLPVSFVSVDEDDGRNTVTKNIVLEGDGKTLDIEWDANHLAALKTTWASKGLDGSVTNGGKTLSISTSSCSSTMTLGAATPGGKNWTYTNTPVGASAICAVGAPFQMVASDGKGFLATCEGDDFWLKSNPAAVPVLVSSGTPDAPAAPLDLTDPTAFRQVMPYIRDIEVVSTQSKLNISFIRDMQYAGYHSTNGYWQYGSGGYLPPRIAYAKPANMPAYAYYVDNPNDGPPLTYEQPTPTLLYTGGPGGQMTDARGVFEILPYKQVGSSFYYKLDWKADYYTPAACGAWSGSGSNYQDAYIFGSIKLVVTAQQIDPEADPSQNPKEALVFDPVDFRTALQRIQGNCVTMYQ